MISMQQRYDELRQIVKDRLEDWPPRRVGYHWPGYTWDHTLRVINLSLSMARETGANEKVIRYAALLHDIAKPAGDEHARIGAQQAQELMQERDFEPRFIERVTSAIATHAGGISPDDPIENRLLKDADFIDANFGLVGTWRFITIRGGRDDPLETIVREMDEWLDRKEELAMRLVTDTGSRIAHERLERMLSFCGRLHEHFFRSASDHPAQMWLARFVHKRADTGRMMEQVQELMERGEAQLPEGVMLLVKRLAHEIEGTV